MYRELDIENWPRRTTFEFFREYDDPFFNFTADLDVTTVHEFSKHHGLAYSLTVLFYSLVAANRIPEFRIRLKKGRLVEFDQIHSTQTILNDDETFSFAYFEMKNDVFEFDREGKKSREKYKILKTFDVESDRLDMIYYSTIPWVSFTSFKHASKLNNQQTVPRIVFGKLFDDRGRKLMPVNVEANHMIMDGLHVGRFFNIFQDLLNEPN